MMGGVFVINRIPGTVLYISFVLLLAAAYFTFPKFVGALGVIFQYALLALFAVVILVIIFELFRRKQA